MLEHELLMLIAAPLLVAAHANGILLWAFPRGARAPLARFFQTRSIAGLWQPLTEPLTATAVQALALWLWHAPPLFDLALAQPGWHIVQHLSFLASALLFWSAMLDARRRRRESALVIGCLFATTLIGGALGALMAFSSSPWYAGYRSLGLDAFGLDPTQDQQIAGLLMWVPGGLVHMGVALALLAATLRTSAQPGEKADVL
jgi:cytochrome c oxidase assembly factor CtaG